MLPPALLEGERQSCVIWYKSFRQSPNETALNEGAQAVVGFAEADAECLGQFALGEARVGVQVAQGAEGDVFVQTGALGTLPPYPVGLGHGRVLVLCAIGLLGRYRGCRGSLGERRSFRAFML